MSIAEDRDGAIWVDTYSRGIYRFNGDQGTKFGIQSGLGSDRIFDRVQDGSGTTWVWTAAGLGRIRKDKCAYLDEVNGFPPDLQGNVLLDERGHLWIITQKGIAVVDLAEADQVIDYGANSVKLPTSAPTTDLAMFWGILPTTAL